MRDVCGGVGCATLALSLSCWREDTHAAHAERYRHDTVRRTTAIPTCVALVQDSACCVLSSTLPHAHAHARKLAPQARRRGRPQASFLTFSCTQRNAQKRRQRAGESHGNTQHTSCEYDVHGSIGACLPACLPACVQVALARQYLYRYVHCNSTPCTEYTARTQ